MLPMTSLHHPPAVVKCRLFGWMVRQGCSKVDPGPSPKPEGRNPEGNPKSEVRSQPRRVHRRSGFRNSESRVIKAARLPPRSTTLCRVDGFLGLRFMLLCITKYVSWAGDPGLEQKMTRKNENSSEAELKNRRVPGGTHFVMKSQIPSTGVRWPSEHL
jgi:hypothetical protein